MCPIRTFHFGVCSLRARLVCYYRKWNDFDTRVTITNASRNPQSPTQKCCSLIDRWLLCPMYASKYVHPAHSYLTQLIQQWRPSVLLVYAHTCVTTGWMLPPTLSYASSDWCSNGLLYCVRLDEYKLYSTFLQQSAFFSCEVLPHKVNYKTTMV